MKILGSELIEIRLPLKEAFTTGLGARSDRRLLLLRMEGPEGHEGWGECVAGEEPSYAYETTETAWYVLTTFLLPHLVGHDVQAPEDLWSATPLVRGHPAARATAETAMWDLQAKEIGVPVWDLLGGVGGTVEVGISIGLQPSVEDLLRKVEDSLALGYARVKLKIAPGIDVEMVRSVRERFPEAPLSVDANGAYSLADAGRLKELDAFELLMIEQPLGVEDLVDHARLAERLDTPICLDESLRSIGAVRSALELEACDIVSVKLGMVGGLSAARGIHDVCRARGVPAWCGGMLESGVGRAHNLALATLPGFTLPGDISESGRYWDRDIVTPEFSMQRGRMAVPQAPGIGVDPNREMIRDLAVRSASFGRVDRPVIRDPTHGSHSNSGERA